MLTMDPFRTGTRMLQPLSLIIPRRGTSRFEGWIYQWGVENEVRYLTFKLAPL